MNYFWVNQNGRAPNNRSNRTSEPNNQSLNNQRSPGGHSRTPQDMPPRGQIPPFPPVSRRANPQPQIHPNFTQGRYQDPNIVEARTTQPSRVPFPTSTTNNNTISSIPTTGYCRVLPIDLSSDSRFQPRNMVSIDNTDVFNSLASYGNLLNLGVAGNSFNGGFRSVPNRFSNPSRPNFVTNSFLYSSRPHFSTIGFPYSLSSNFLNNQRNLFSYGENSNNSLLINNPCTGLNMNNFYNPRNFLCFEGNSNNSFGFDYNNNFMINPSTSVNRNNRVLGLETVVMPLPTPIQVNDMINPSTRVNRNNGVFGLENVVMPLPTRIQVNDLELVGNPSTNAGDLARERALKRPLTLNDVGQETNRSSKRPRNNDSCEGQQSRIKELLLFKDRDDGEKNSSSTSGIARDDGGNGNDEENLDL